MEDDLLSFPSTVVVTNIITNNKEPPQPYDDEEEDDNDDSICDLVSLAESITERHSTTDRHYSFSYLKDKIQSRTPIVEEMQSEVRNIYSSKNNNSSFDDMSRSNNDLYFDDNSMDIEELDRFVSMKQQQPPNIYTPTSKSSSRIRPPIGGILHQVSAKTIQHHNSVESKHASTNDSPQVKDNHDNGMTKRRKVSPATTTRSAKKIKTIRNQEILYHP